MLSPLGTILLDDGLFGSVECLCVILYNRAPSTELLELEEAGV